MRELYLQIFRREEYLFQDREQIVKLSENAAGREHTFASTPLRRCPREPKIDHRGMIDSSYVKTYLAIANFISRPEVIYVEKKNLSSDDCICVHP